MTPIKSYLLDGPFQILSKSGDCDTADFGARKICVESLSREGYLEERRLGKGKGCDIGYALAGRPREEVNSVDTRTVTAL
jgi:hypothetical protein